MRVLERLRGQGLRRFTENLLSLATLNVATYLFPLILVPILLARLGQVNYSIILFVQSTMAYLLGFTDFGFSLTGTKLISRSRDDSGRVREIFWMIILTKIALFCLAVIVLVLLKEFTTLLKYEGRLFVWGTIQVLGQVLLLDWYFRGINELRALSIFNLIVRSLSFGFLLALVQEPDDILLVLQITGLVSLTLGLIVFFICIRRVGFARPHRQWWQQDFRGLWHNGLTGLLNTTSRQGHLFIMRQLLTESAFAPYSIAFKIVISAYAILSALPQTIFAHMGDKVHDPVKFARWLRNFLIINVLVYLVAALALIGGVPLLLRVLTFESSPELFVAVLRRQSVMLACAGVSTVLGATFGVLTGRERTLFYTLLVANLAMIAFLVMAHINQASLLLYAWTLPILEAVWAILLLHNYLKYRKMLV